MWPCVIVIKEFDPATGSFSGTVEWSSLNALHSIEGKLEAEQLVYREVKFLWRGNALLNCVYTYSLKPSGTAGTITGTWKDPKSGRGGPAELNLQAAAPDRKRNAP